MRKKNGETSYVQNLQKAAGEEKPAAAVSGAEKLRSVEVTPKERKFLKAYFKTFNATEAYQTVTKKEITAESAATQGYRLLARIKKKSTGRTSLMLPVSTIFASLTRSTSASTPRNPSSTRAATSRRLRTTALACALLSCSLSFLNAGNRSSRSSIPGRMAGPLSSPTCPKTNASAFSLKNSLGAPVNDNDLAQLILETQAGRARASHLEFMRFNWRGFEKLIPGFHTRKICERIDRAITDYREGKTTFLLINVHPRAGKSDIVSRYLGPHFIGEFPGAEVMQVSYAADKAVEFSAFSRLVIDSDRYRIAYPDLQLSSDTNRKDHYLTSLGGGILATGLYGHMTGSGFSLGILDDYCSGRAEAESKVQRDTAWEAFTNDFLTRMAPKGIVIVLATQWHDDDISGRIVRAMAADPHFPRFEVMKFPARSADYKGDGKYPGEFLFEERYSKSWYLGQYASLGKYSSAALMDCNPVLREGGRFNLGNIDWLDEIPAGAGSEWARVWDLAHTAKERSGDDPDWTSGTLLSFERVPGDPVPHLWISHVLRCRDEAPERDRKIRMTVGMDGTAVRQALGHSLDAKDAYEYLRTSMPEIAWASILERGDKGARATPLEPIFESDYHVHVKRGDWNEAWIDELLRFDGLGKNHDDQVDNLSAGYILQIGGGSADPEMGSIMASRRARRHA